VKTNLNVLRRRISEPARTVRANVAEFIHLISSEANEICEQESKKTIAPEHILGALKVRVVSLVRIYNSELTGAATLSVSASTRLQPRLRTS
jgi:hypothetical protein